MNADERRGIRFEHVELTRVVIGVFLQVYRELGYGFLESVYRGAMTIGLRDAGLTVEPEVRLQARFRGHRDRHIPGRPAGRGSRPLNYLRCTVLETGLILNFGPTPKVRRLVFANQRKHPQLQQPR